MGNWLGVLPEILLAVGLLGLPGLLIGFCLRFRLWDAVAFAVPLSLGALGIADEVAIHAHVRWGIPVVAATTAVLGVGCLIVLWVAGRQAEVEARLDGVPWTRLQHRIAWAATLGAAVIGLIVIARGMGSPQALNQSVDGAYHVNAINAMAQRHSASPGIYGQILDPSTSGGFYPPLFAGVGALLVITTGIGPIAAANVVAVAIAFLWPFCISIAVRRIARPTSFGYSVAMIGAVTVGLFPALLLNWGTVWPNALSVLAVPAGLVAVIRLFGVDRAADGADDPHGRLPWVTCFVAALISAPGLLMGQPNSVFAVFYLSVPVLFWFGWRRWVTNASGLAAKACAAVLVVLGVVGVVLAVVWASDRLSAVASAKNFYWPPWETWPQAVGQMVTLSSHFSPTNMAFAALVVVGLLVAAGHGRGRVLIFGYAVFAGLAALAAGSPSPSVYRWTGYWYNDYLRIVALLPVVVLPLAALAADALRDAAKGYVVRLLDQEGLSWRPRVVTLGMVASLSVLLGIVVLQKGLGTARISSAISESYTYGPGQMVSPDQEAMYKRLAARLAPGEAIAGNPFTGESLAGVLSGRSVVYPTLAQPTEHDQVLVALKFDTYRSDPQVCAAVKALHIGVVVTGPIYHSDTPLFHSWFAGFDNMASIPGLTQIDSGGGAIAYRVGPCAG